MTSTMKEPELSEAVIAKIRERFAGECKRMLEAVAKDTHCTCGAKPDAGELQHDIYCPVAVMLRAARAVWMMGQPLERC